MSRNRYVSDYRIMESVDARGRIRTGYEYVGKPWVYASDAATVRRARRIIAACAAAGWVAYFTALLPMSTAGRTWYSCLPFIFAALPLGLVSALAWPLYREKPPFEHRHADRVNNRGPAYSFFVTLLSGIALLGEAVSFLRGAELLPGDAGFCMGAALLFACGFICHRQWKRLQCREIK